MKLSILFLISITPIIAFSKARICDGNTYEINQCLKKQIKNYDKKLDKLNLENVKLFKEYRNSICSDISSKYNGGTYESVKYGNCIISLDKWYFQEIRL